MDDTRITVLLPIKYYSPDLLRKAVDSVVRQTCADWRLLLIAEEQDCPGLRSTLDSALKDSRIEIVKNEKWELACKLNAGMERAQTDFVGVLLGDDMWADNAVEVLMVYLARFPDVDFFHSSRRFIDDHDRPISSVYLSKDGFTPQDFVRGSPVKHLLCWRREKAISLGGLDESIKFMGPDDYDFPWTMVEAGAVFKAVPECLYLLRDHRNHYRLTTHVPRSVQVSETKRMMRKHGVSRWQILLSIRAAKRSYLRQCLYRSRLDKWIKESFRYDPRQGWHEKYR